VPPFAGFWSKDEILLFAWDKSPALWAVGLVTAILTAFYMSRQVFMVFFGDAHWDRPMQEAAPELAAERDAEGVHEGHGVGPADALHPHESPWTMTLPLVVLAGLAAIGGALNIPVFDSWKVLEHWLEPVVHFGEAHPDVATGTKIGLAALATVGAISGLLLGAAVYLRNRRDLAARVEQPVLARGWYVDRAVSAFMGGPGRQGFEGVTWFDANVVDGAVDGVATVVREGSGKARLVQTGFVRNYALGLALGVVVIAGLVLSKAVF
jgi:NADH-quinone oxidoreductase subunit L